MARHKEFDRDEALSAAIRVFSDHGYEGTSTDDLLKAMKISRQSMYDTFGDKRSLYLEALKRYNADSLARILADLKGDRSALARIEVALVAFAARPASEATRCCLGVSAICEFGRADAEVATLTDEASRILSSSLESVIRAGIASGDFAADLDVTSAVHFLGATLSGMKVGARGGASPETLTSIAHMALKSLI
ncbi:TetR/AcrR family transcriptional regulator [Rhizobium calliandrae]|uniref:TetR/AcrR family transcriptional regulator n=1 Tax=Rhizobium calliandrae TaxID=1312182 RepID=A0ABT7KC55_9HYPH|nr:TetR/AcrR family transcriptional regulator [Rhizobium calliandrae]MDL2405573.1 TetR/AcrR family transcriptional regulator [Rhizobium calliandrae]